MKVLGATEKTNPAYANAMNYLRECQLKARSSLKAANFLPATEETSVNDKESCSFNEEQMSRIRYQKVAYSLLISERPIPYHIQIGMLSRKEQEKAREIALQYNKLSRTIVFFDDSIGEVHIPNIPTPETVESVLRRREERDHVLLARMHKLATQLEGLPSNLSNDPPLRCQVNGELRNKPGPKIKIVNEIKSTKLHGFQNKVSKIV